MTSEKLYNFQFTIQTHRFQLIQRNGKPNWLGGIEQKRLTLLIIKAPVLKALLFSSFPYGLNLGTLDVNSSIMTHLNACNYGLQTFPL